MSTNKFKAGDRVKYVGLAYPAVTEGVVTIVHEFQTPFPYRVLFDNFTVDDYESEWSIGKHGLLCSEDELELINE